MTGTRLGHRATISKIPAGAVKTTKMVNGTGEDVGLPGFGAVIASTGIAFAAIIRT